MEHRGDRAQQAFGLTQRLMKYQAQCETGLDGNLRIDRLATAFSGRWGMPGRNRFFGKPTVMLPRLINAESYSGQFVTRYLAFGIL